MTSKNPKPTIDLVAGARPNFMKLAPVVREMKKKEEVKARIVHTGQHYDTGMNTIFFSELGIPEPEVHLEVGSGSHGAQTARIIERYEAHLLKSRPSMVVVFGDVNSTVACALAAVKLEIPVVHVEAGLRSFDRAMPEEINRILTDAMSDLLLVSEPSGLANLNREGVPKNKIVHVGNVMIDTLFAELPHAEELKLHEKLGYQAKGYGLVTMHRPSNVDDPSMLKALVETLIDLSKELPLIFPLHPRTRAAMINAGLERLLSKNETYRFLEPLSYRENLSLMSSSKVVLTDSGGIQEETSVLNVPCLTMRNNTERPVTVERGTSRLVGNDIDRIREAFFDAIGGRWPEARNIELWDGRASERIVQSIVGLSKEKKQ